MLSAKKRRRKKKKTENFLNVRKKTNTIVPPKATKCKPKLSNNYKKEELEVRSALSSRTLDNKKSESQTKLIDGQIAFFVNNIASNQFDEAIPENSSEQSLRTNDPALQLASSFVQIDDESPIKKYEQEKFIYNDHDLLYYPGPKTTSETDAQLTKRDDGLFEPQKPLPSNGGMILQINRLNEENAVDWLNQSNEMVGLQQFTQNHRLIRSESSKEFANILYIPRPHINNERLKHSEINREKILKIHIHDLTFHTHPSLNREQVAARNLENLYKQYEMRRNIALSDRLEMKLAALRHLQSLAVNENSANTINKQQYRNDIRDLRNHLHREQRIDRDILKSILEQWKALKKLRSEQGFVSTSVKLSIRAQATDETADQEAFDRRFELELNEIFEESMEMYIRDRRNRKNVASGDEDFELIKKLNKPDIENTRKNLKEVYSNCVRPPGEPIVLIELHKIDDLIDPKRIRKHFFLSKFVLQIAFDNTTLNSARNARSIVGDRIILDATYSVKFRNTIPNSIHLTVIVFSILFLIIRR